MLWSDLHYQKCFDLTIFVYKIGVYRARRGRRRVSLALFFRDQGLGFSVQEFGNWVLGVGCRFQGFECWGVGSSFRVWGLGVGWSRVEGFGFRV